MYQCIWEAKNDGQPRASLYFKLNIKTCYLETNNDPNAPIYEHFGFKVMEKTIVLYSDVPHYSMLFDCK